MYLFLRIKDVYWPFRKKILAILSLLFVAKFFPICAAYLSGLIMDAIIQKDFARLQLLTAVFFVILLVEMIISYTREFKELRGIDFAFAKHITLDSMEKLMHFSIGQHRNQHSGLKQSVISKGIHSLTSFGFNMLYQVLPLVIEITLVMIVLITLTLPIGLLIVSGVLAFTCLTIWINLRLGPKLKELDDLRHKHSKIESEIIRHLDIIKINTEEKLTLKQLAESYDRIRNKGIETWSEYLWFGIYRSVSLHAVKSALLLLAGYLIYSGQYPAGVFVTWLSWSDRTLGQLWSIGQLQRQMMDILASIKKYFELLDTEPAIKAHPEAIFPDIDGRIEFDRVSFAYPKRIAEEDPKDEDDGDKIKSQVAISNLTLTIQPGQRIAFVGKSGSGKSTVINLLLRAYDPQGGCIRISGHDIREIDHKHLLHNIGVVEQGIRLLDASLRDNIVFGTNGKKDTITNNDVEEVIDMSGISSFRDKLEDGLNTIIGERGIKLSGGQGQRVGIARALIKKAPILIFDEATSNLDTEHESHIGESIQKISRATTIITIAHRLATIIDSDKIFVFESGKIVGEGTHTELLVSCPQYQKLVEKQMRRSKA